MHQHFNIYFIIGSSFPRPVLVKDTGDKATSSGVSYVSVTQETNSPSKLDLGTPKGRRQRQAVSGDISDYTVSFQDLNAVTTNIRSNILVPPSDSLKSVDQSFITVQSADKCTKTNQNSSTVKVLKPCYYAEVIDAVAKGLDLDSSSLSSTLESEPTNVVGANVGQSDADKIAVEKSGKRPVEVETVASKSNKEARESNRSDGVENVEQTSVVGNKEGPRASNSETKESPIVHTSDNVKIAERNTQQKADAECITIVEPEIVVPIIFKPLENVTGGSTTNVTGSNNQSASASVSTANEKHINARKEDSNNKRKRESNTSTATKRPDLSEKSRGIDNDLSSSGLSHDRKRRKHDSSEKTSSSNSKSGDKTLSSDCQIIAQSAKENSPESWFPDTWTDHMKDFYGSSHNEDFELDDVMSSLPGMSNNSLHYSYCPQVSSQNNLSSFTAYLFRFQRPMECLQGLDAPAWLQT